MCGITGFFALAPDNSITQDELKNMTRAIRHRGPNDSGCLLIDKKTGRKALFRDSESTTALDRGEIGLGHRRLSILDLSERGQQPMGHAESGVWIVFNGEVYNYVELSKELESLGHRFETTTDTEVVLKAYVEWGGKCFAKFNGMWGLAIYDPRSDKLVLSRDRFGKKPLYYYDSGKYILFASEIKALFTHSKTPKEVNDKKLIDYAGRHYRYVDGDSESFFKDINQVPKGTTLTISSTGVRELNKYWEVAPGPLLTDEYSEQDLVHMFRELLEDAVKIRLRSDVPVGCMLSGGLDSTSITCLAAEHSADMHTFSGITGSGCYDESEYIEAVVQKTGSKQQYIYPAPGDLFSILNEMLEFHDEPVCTVSWYCTYVLTKEIGKANIPVILTGHGGDELLAGYWYHYHYHFKDMREKLGDDSSEHNAWLRNHKRNPEEYHLERKYVEELAADKSLELKKFSQYVGALSPRLRENSAKVMPESPFTGSLSRRLYLEMFSEAIPASLRAEDRNMMAFSIENRVPFLDYRLAEFCFRLGNSVKIKDGLGKWLLRESMKGILPEKVRTRKDKTGFNAPFDEWIRNENREQVEELMAANSYVNNEIYDHKKVKELYRKHLSGENHYMFFWQYINLNLWHNLFFS
ncbi:MAG: asparagine synthase (glutamine-hydrolyzing) [Desulfovibrio sp. S3730MH75]|nr:MAG: asparagine synthase (glutamine-hydrolyzing) [Desulfovibrio sp. S3730MH75]